MRERESARKTSFDVIIIIIRKIFDGSCSTLQIPVVASNAWNQKSVSWMTPGNPLAVAENSADSNFRPYAEATVRLTRTSAASDKKLADRDFHFERSIMVPAVQVRRNSERVKYSLSSKPRLS